MTARAASSLDSNDLARRLHDLVGDERSIQVEFLLHLDEFDRRQAFLEAGFGSLWENCLRALHLREGAAGRRIGAMRALRRFPKLEAPLRDGRLCLSTVALLAQVLTEDNLDELVARAAFRTKAEVDHLVASLAPRTPPKDGIRKLAEGPRTPEPALLRTATPAEANTRPPAPSPTVALTGGSSVPAPILAPAAGDAIVDEPSTGDAAPRAACRGEMQAVSQDRWSLRVTIDAALKEDVDTLTMLLSHKVPNGDLAAVLREALRCGIEKHGKRKGAVPPARERTRPPAPASAAAEPTRAIPADVRRAVWARDGGCCAFVGKDGRRCGSRWQLEIDHIYPLSCGGESTLENLRLRCRKHNMLHAEEVYGREHMARFRREPRQPSRAGGFTIAGDSALTSRTQG